MLAGIALGFGLGLAFWYLVAIRPLVNKLTRLRYDGFRPETPMPERPKTVPMPKYNET